MGREKRSMFKRLFSGDKGKSKDKEDDKKDKKDKEKKDKDRKDKDKQELKDLKDQKDKDQRKQDKERKRTESEGSHSKESRPRKPSSSSGGSIKKSSSSGSSSRPKAKGAGGGGKGKNKRKKTERKSHSRKIDVSKPLEWPAEPELVLEYHKAKSFLTPNEEWFLVELNEFECLVDSQEILSIMAQHTKYTEMEPDEYLEEFFEFVDDVATYDEIINYDVWQEFRDIKYPC